MAKICANQQRQGLNGPEDSEKAPNFRNGGKQPAVCSSFQTQTRLGIH